MFDGPIADVNPLDAQPFGLPLPRPARAARLKEWQAFQIVDDRLFTIVAIFDAKVLALAQVKVYDRTSGDKYAFERQLPTWAVKIGQGVLDSETSYAGKGCVLRFVNRWPAIDLELDVEPTADFPGLRGKLAAQPDGDPLVVAIPFADNRGMYSHKGPLRAEGELRLGEQVFPVRPDATRLMMDDHKGYYPFVMRWDWVTAAGRDTLGRRVAFNLTRNQSTDPARFHENCLWIDGRAHLLPPVTFVRTGYAAGDRWRMTDETGAVDLVFTIQVEGKVAVDAIVVRSDYQGPFGTFEGTLRASDGAEARIDGLFGMGERFLLRC